MYLQSAIHLIKAGEIEVKNATEFTMSLALLRMKIDEMNKLRLQNGSNFSNHWDFEFTEKITKKMNEKIVDPSMCIPVINHLFSYKTLEKEEGEKKS